MSTNPIFVIPEARSAIRDPERCTAGRALHQIPALSFTPAGMTWAGVPLEKAIEYERDLQTICFATQDAAEASAAVKETRPRVLRWR